MQMSSTNGIRRWKVKVAVEWEMVTYGETKLDAVEVAHDSLREQIEKGKTRIPTKAQPLVYGSTVRRADA